MKLILQITKGVVRSENARRSVMFVIVLAALLMLFTGLTFLNKWLLETPVLFLGYWAVCTWLTFCSGLLAIYDLIALRLKAREERRRLKMETIEQDRVD